MKLFKQTLLTAAIAFSTASAWAEDVTIAAASDLKFALEDIKTAYVTAHPDDNVKITFGSSGKLSTQIEQGAPFDLFFSADIKYPKQLAAAKQAASEVKPYALGRIVLWSNTHDASQLTLESLKEEQFKHIAIADPSHAPYGKRAEEALTASKLWDTLKPKLVYGENIAQTAQFIESGNADIGIIALALALNPELSKQGGHYLIDDALHEPLEQAFILTTHGKDNTAAQRFAEYMQHPAARKIMVKYGFVLPGEAADTIATADKTATTGAQ
ncbi:MAG: molybdate ABC transporter substrate-binding protein [Candidatus Thiothrix putei]|uniref:Molybdate ABC transporter substrate-binding protein n=1 Tax=Candidatus Thiothrix putei TaxID=3080811 RepID=A0AA95HE79_9GAMM|nr:MAG: molybdate ABC transporter substrate-binding protein [Candidatus Thiothrix putei]